MISYNIIWFRMWAITHLSKTVEHTPFVVIPFRIGIQVLMSRPLPRRPLPHKSVLSFWPPCHSVSLASLRLEEAQRLSLFFELEFDYDS